MSKHSPAVIHDGQPHYEDINTPVIFMLTLITAVVTYAMIAAAQGLYYQLKNAQLERNNGASVTMSAKYIAVEKSLIEAGSEERKITPIAESMASIVASLGSPEKTHVDEEPPEAAH